MAYLRGKDWMSKIPDPHNPGTYIYFTLGTKSALTKRQAKEKEIDVRREVLRSSEAFFDISENTDLTVSGLLNYWMENHSMVKRKPNVSKDDGYLITKINQVLGEVGIHVLRANHINNYMAKRRRDVSYRSRQKRGVSETTIFAELRLLKFAFRLAREKWDITTNDPFLKVDMPKGDKKRVRFLLDEEEKAMAETIQAKLERDPGFIWFPRMLEIARTTAIRASNLCEITMRHVDFKGEGFYLPETKSGDPHWVPWQEDSEAIVLQIVRERGEIKPNSRLFVDGTGRSITRNRVSRTQLALCRAAGVEDYRWHDNRHDCISKMIQAGATLFEAGEVAGHSDLSSTQRYAHLLKDNKRKAVKRISIRYKSATNRKRSNG